MRGRHLVNGRAPRSARATALISTLISTLIAATALVGVAPAGAAHAAAKKPAPLTILVTNDDGVAAPGIDAVVEALRTDKRNKVVVVAPATNNSGAGGKSTPGGAPGGPATTASGYAATAVQGYPADAVDYAFDVMHLTPNVVVSGANFGQNLGPFVDVSGTVGAAREGARRGVPALAVSQQLGDAPDYPTSARLAVDWVQARRRALARTKAGAALTEIDSINAPNCPAGRIRGVYESTAAPGPGTEAAIRTVAECASTATTFANDVEAFNAGYATLTKVPVHAA